MFLHFITQNSFIRSGYCSSDANATTFEGNDVLMLIKKKFCAHFFLRSLPSRMDRSVLFANIYSKNFSICVGTSHLESSKSAPVRKQQLEIILSLLQQQPLDAQNGRNDKISDILFMGDMNFDRNYVDGCCIEEEVIVHNEFVDMWSSLHPDNPGHTRLKSKLHQPKRIDRVLVKSQYFLPENIEVIGKEDIGNNCEACIKKRGACTISDHYGVFATLRIK